MSGMLCTVMVASSMTPIYAQTTDRNSSEEKMDEVALEEAKEKAEISKEEAIKKAKIAIDIPEGFEREDIRFNTRYGDQAVWRVDWNKSDSRIYQHISVTVDAESGDVVSMRQSFNDQDEERSFPPEVDYHKAVSIAQKYIMENYTGLKGGFVLDETTKERSQENPFRRTYAHQVAFFQEVNGVPFKQNRIRFSINGNGKITSMNFNWDHGLSYESAEDVVSYKEAVDSLDDHLKADLQYQLNRYAYRPGEEADPKLVYNPQTTRDGGNAGFGVLDANSGEWLNHFNEPFGEGEVYTIAEKPLAETADPLDIPKEELTQEEAVAVVEESFDIPEDYELENTNYNENPRSETENPTWTFYWRNNDEPPHPMQDVRVTVDAKTGELVRFHNDQVHYGNNEMPEDFEVQLTKEEAKEKAVELVKKVAKSKLDRLYVTTPRENKFSDEDVPRSYNITFVRKENGLQVQGQQINVSILSDSGKIVRYYQNWNNNVEFPAVKNVISEEKAKEILLNNYEMDLVHHLPRTRNNEEEIKDTMLVYQPKPEITDYRVYLDAKTGDWMDEETGEVYSKEKQEAQDIADHPNQKELQNMLDYNILKLDEDNNLNPNEELTRSELVKVMMKALGYDGYYYSNYDDLSFEDVTEEHQDYNYIIAAVRRNILDNEGGAFNPDDQANRAFASKLLVEALGYDKLASVEGVFETSFEDVNGEEYAGHIALVNRLDILNGDGEQFHPDNAITKAEAAVALTKFLELEPKLNENR